MPVAETAALIPYEAFTIEEGNLPAFVVRAHDEASVFPYAHLLGVGWVMSEGKHQLLIEHRFFSLYLHGNHLEPLLEAFERYTVHRIHVFDEGRHRPVVAGATVVTAIAEHYEAEQPGNASRRAPPKG